MKIKVVTTTSTNSSVVIYANSNKEYSITLIYFTNHLPVAMQIDFMVVPTDALDTEHEHLHIVKPTFKCSDHGKLVLYIHKIMCRVNFANLQKINFFELAATWIASLKLPALIIPNFDFASEA